MLATDRCRYFCSTGKWTTPSKYGNGAPAHKESKKKTTNVSSVRKKGEILVFIRLSYCLCCNRGTKYLPIFFTVIFLCILFARLRNWNGIGICYSLIRIRIQQKSRKTGQILLSMSYDLQWLCTLLTIPMVSSANRSRINYAYSIFLLIRVPPSQPHISIVCLFVCLCCSCFVVGFHITHSMFAFFRL